MSFSRSRKAAARVEETSKAGRSGVRTDEMASAALGPQGPRLALATLGPIDRERVDRRQRRAHRIAGSDRHARCAARFAIHDGLLHANRVRAVGVHRHGHGCETLPAGKQCHQQQKRNQLSCGRAVHAKNYDQRTRGPQESKMACMAARRLVMLLACAPRKKARRRGARRAFPCAAVQGGRRAGCWSGQAARPSAFAAACADGRAATRSMNALIAGHLPAKSMPKCLAQPSTV